VNPFHLLQATRWTDGLYERALRWQQQAERLFDIALLHVLREAEDIEDVRLATCLFVALAK
jgi:hypothetical protein